MLNNLLIYALPGWIMNATMNLIFPAHKNYALIRKIDLPLDFGKNFFDGRRILGNSNSTLGILVAVITPFFVGFALAQPLSLVFLKSACVCAGNILGSFTKRRMGYERGAFMPFVDHGDYMIVTGVVFYILKLETLNIIILALLVTYIFHPLVCYIGYKLKIKDEPY